MHLLHPGEVMDMQLHSFTKGAEAGLLGTGGWQLGQGSGIPKCGASDQPSGGHVADCPAGLVSAALHPWGQCCPQPAAKGENKQEEQSATWSHLPRPGHVLLPAPCTGQGILRRGHRKGIPGGSRCSARGRSALRRGDLFGQAWAGTESGDPRPGHPRLPLPRLARSAAPGPLPAFETAGGAPTPSPGPPRPQPPVRSHPPGARRREGGAARAWRENDQGPRAAPERSARLMLPARRPRRTKAALRPRLRPPRAPRPELASWRDINELACLCSPGPSLLPPPGGHRIYPSLLACLGHFGGSPRLPPFARPGMQQRGKRTRDGLLGVRMVPLVLLLLLLQLVGGAPVGQRLYPMPASILQGQWGTGTGVSLRESLAADGVAVGDRTLGFTLR